MLKKFLSYSPNFPRASATRYTHAKHGPILYSQQYFWLLRVFSDVWKACKAIWTINLKEGEDMLSKARAEIEIFWTVHSRAFVFSFIKGRTWLNYFETFLCLFCTRSRWPFALKMKLWHHYTEILFLRLWESFFPKINKFLDGIRDTVVWFTDCVVLLYKIPPIGKIKF